MKAYDAPQGSPEWYKLRLGRPTASRFGDIITAKQEKYAAAAETYLAELIAESLGEISDFAGTPDTEHGVRYEREALRWLKLNHGIATKPVGFCVSDCGRYGGSPDALVVGINAPVEVKCPKIKTFIGWWRDYERTGLMPFDHKAQVHGEMIVTGADHAYFLAYVPNPYLETLLVRVERDGFTEKLEGYLTTFCDELEAARRALTGEHYEEIFTNNRQ